MPENFNEPSSELKNKLKQIMLDAIRNAIDDENIFNKTKHHFIDGINQYIEFLAQKCDNEQEMEEVFYNGKDGAVPYDKALDIILDTIYKAYKAEAERIEAEESGEGDDEIETEENSEDNDDDEPIYGSDPELREKLKQVMLDKTNEILKDEGCSGNERDMLVEINGYLDLLYKTHESDYEVEKAFYDGYGEFPNYEWAAEILFNLLYNRGQLNVSEEKPEKKEHVTEKEGDYNAKDGYETIDVYIPDRKKMDLQTIRELIKISNRANNQGNAFESSEGAGNGEGKCDEYIDAVKENTDVSIVELDADGCDDDEVRKEVEYFKKKSGTVYGCSFDTDDGKYYVLIGCCDYSRSHGQKPYPNLFFELIAPTSLNSTFETYEMDECEKAIKVASTIINRLKRGDVDNIVCDPVFDSIMLNTSDSLFIESMAKLGLSEAQMEAIMSIHEAAYGEDDEEEDDSYAPPRFWFKPSIYLLGRNIDQKVVDVIERIEEILPDADLEPVDEPWEESGMISLDTLKDIVMTINDSDDIIDVKYIPSVANDKHIEILLGEVGKKEPDYLIRIDVYSMQPVTDDEVNELATKMKENNI